MLLKIVYLALIIGLIQLYDLNSQTKENENKYSEKELVDIKNKFQNNFTQNEQIGFIENKGQWPDEVLYMVNTNSLRAWITKKGIKFEQFEYEKESNNKKLISTFQEKTNVKKYLSGLEFVNPAKISKLNEKTKELTQQYNFFIGNDKNKHKTNVKAYSEIKLKNIYPQIDMKFYLEEGELRYDFIINPGGIPENILFDIKGVENTKILNGELVIETLLNPIIQKGLFAYQETKENSVTVDFELNKNQLKIKTGNYNKNKTLIIDPLTLIANSPAKIKNSLFNGEAVYDIEIYNGNLFFIGYNLDNNYQANYGVFNGDRDIILGKQNLSLNTIWTAQIGSSSNDYAFSLKLYNDDIYFVGTSTGNDYPLENEFYNYNNSYDGIFTVLNTNGGLNIKYSTYFGGSGYDLMSDIKVNNLGDVYVVGWSTNTNWDVNPVGFGSVDPIQTQSYSNNLSHGVIIALEPDIQGNDLLFDYKFKSIFGGDDITSICGLDLDDNNNLYIMGVTKSTDNYFYPTINAYSSSKSLDYSDYFISKLHYNGVDELIIDYNTFLFAEDSNWPEVPFVSIKYGYGKIHIGGTCNSDGLPIVNAFDNTFNSNNLKEGFISVIEPNSNGSNDLIYSSYFGGFGESQIMDIDLIDDCERIVFTGQTRSKLSGYNRTVQHDYNSINENIYVGIVDISYTTQSTLVDLAYYSEIDKGNVGFSVKHLPSSNDIFIGGSTGGDMSTLKYTSEVCFEYLPVSCDCPIFVNPEIENFFLKENLQLFVTKGDGCPEGFCNLTHTFEIPSYYNLGCYTHYEVWNSETQTWSQRYAFSTGNQLNEIDKCIPINTNYEIRIRMFKNGSTQDYCLVAAETIKCTCDCEEDRNDWLDLYTINDGSSECGEFECNWQYNLNIPSAGNCFTHFKKETIEDGGIPVISDFIPMSQIVLSESGCISQGTELTIKYHLYHSINDLIPCTIEQTIECPCECPSYIDSWITLNSEKGESPCDENECLISYTVNDIPDCYTHISYDDGTTQSNILPITSVLPGLERCIGTGDFEEITFSFYKGIEDENPCEVEKRIGCSPRDFDTDCNDECEKIYRNDTYEVYLGNCTCPVQIFCKVRVDCDNFKEIFIEGINIPNSSNCINCDYDLILNEAIYQVIRNSFKWKKANHIYYCDDYYKVSLNSCWAEWTYIEEQEVGPDKIIKINEPCESECCVTRIRVCQFAGSDQLSFEIIEDYTNQVNCENVTTLNGNDETIPCLPKCDLIDGGVLLPKEIIEIDKEESDKLFKQDRTKPFIKFNTYQTNDRIILKIAETNAIDIEIYLTDIQGKSIVKEKVLENETYLEIFTGDLTNGTYIFNIVLNGKEIHTKKFNIVK